MKNETYRAANANRPQGPMYDQNAARNMPPHNRSGNTGQPRQAPTGRHNAAYADGPGSRAGAGTRTRTGSPPQARRRAGGPGRPRRKKKRYGIVIVLLVLAVLGVGVYGILNVYMNRISGSEVLPDDIGTPVYKGQKVVSGLICGLDYDNEGADGYSTSDKVGRTDMILYMRYDTEANKMALLQIPRDTYVGPELATGNTYKINALYYCAANPENRMEALARTIYDQFKLPVDFYATIDMDALKEIVDIKGWIEVYVPMDITDPDYPGTGLEAGLRNLTGDQVEFLLRNRHNPGYNDQGDIARLQTQQSFYSALYREFKTLQPKDLLMWMDVLTYRIKTDMDLIQLGGLAQKALSISGADITFVRPPCGSATYNDRAVVSLEKEGTAELLNQYFRAPEDAVSASGLDIQELPLYVGVMEADVKTMADVQSTEPVSG